MTSFANTPVRTSATDSGPKDKQPSKGSDAHNQALDLLRAGDRKKIRAASEGSMGEDVRKALHDLQKESAETSRPPQGLGSAPEKKAENTDKEPTDTAQAETKDAASPEGEQTAPAEGEASGEIKPFRAIDPKSGAEVNGDGAPKQSDLEGYTPDNAPSQKDEKSAQKDAEKEDEEGKEKREKTKEKDLNKKAEKADQGPPPKAEAKVSAEAAINIPPAQHAVMPVPSPELLVQWVLFEEWGQIAAMQDAFGPGKGAAPAQGPATPQNASPTQDTNTPAPQGPTPNTAPQEAMAPQEGEESVGMGDRMAGVTQAVGMGAATGLLVGLGGAALSLGVAVIEKVLFKGLPFVGASIGAISAFYDLATFDYVGTVGRIGDVFDGDRWERDPWGGIADVLRLIADGLGILTCIVDLVAAACAIAGIICLIPPLEPAVPVLEGIAIALGVVGGIMSITQTLLMVLVSMCRTLSVLTMEGNAEDIEAALADLEEETGASVGGIVGGVGEFAGGKALGAMSGSKKKAPGIGGGSDGGSSGGKKTKSSGKKGKGDKADFKPAKKPDKKPNSNISIGDHRKPQRNSNVTIGEHRNNTAPERPNITIGEHRNNTPSDSGITIGGHRTGDNSPASGTDQDGLGALDTQWSRTTISPDRTQQGNANTIGGHRTFQGASPTGEQGSSMMGNHRSQFETASPTGDQGPSMMGNHRAFQGASPTGDQGSSMMGNHRTFQGASPTGEQGSSMMGNHRPHFETASPTGDQGSSMMGNHRPHFEGASPTGEQGSSMMGNHRPHFEGASPTGEQGPSMMGNHRPATESAGASSGGGRRGWLSHIDSDRHSFADHIPGVIQDYAGIFGGGNGLGSMLVGIALEYAMGAGEEEEAVEADAQHSAAPVQQGPTQDAQAGGGSSRIQTWMHAAQNQAPIQPLPKPPHSLPTLENKVSEVDDLQAKRSLLVGQVEQLEGAKVQAEQYQGQAVAAQNSGHNMKDQMHSADQALTDKQNTVDQSKEKFSEYKSDKSQADSDTSSSSGEGLGLLKAFIGVVGICPSFLLPGVLGDAMDKAEDALGGDDPSKDSGKTAKGEGEGGGLIEKNQQTVNTSQKSRQAVVRDAEKWVSQGTQAQKESETMHSEASATQLQHQNEILMIDAQIQQNTSEIQTGYAAMEGWATEQSAVAQSNDQAAKQTQEGSQDTQSAAPQAQNPAAQNAGNEELPQDLVLTRDALQNAAAEMRENITAYLQEKRQSGDVTPHLLTMLGTALTDIDQVVPQLGETSAKLLQKHIVIAAKTLDEIHRGLAAQRIADQEAVEKARAEHAEKHTAPAESSSGATQHQDVFYIPPTEKLETPDENILKDADEIDELVEGLNEDGSSTTGIWYVDAYAKRYQDEFRDEWRDGYVDPDYFLHEDPFDFELKPGISATEGLQAFFEGLTLCQEMSLSVATEYKQILHVVGATKFDEMFGQKDDMSDRERLTIQADLEDENLLHEARKML